MATDVTAGVAADEAGEPVEAQTRAEKRQRQLEAARRKHETSAGAVAARAAEDLDAVVGRSRSLLELRQAEQTVLGELRAAAPDDDLDDLAARLPVLTLEAIKESVGVAGDQVDYAVAELETKQERRATLAEELRRAKQDRDAAALRQQEVDALDEMAELARRWARLQMMAGLLGRLARAVGSRVLAATLTSGRVQGLSAADESGEARSLVVHLSGDLHAEADDTSDGTADQVFLALRLAGIRQRRDVARTVAAEVMSFEPPCSSGDARADNGMRRHFATRLDL